MALLAASKSVSPAVTWVRGPSFEVEPTVPRFALNAVEVESQRHPVALDSTLEVQEFACGAQLELEQSAYLGSPHVILTPPE